MVRSIHTDPHADRTALAFTGLLLDEIADQRVRHGRDHHQALDHACRQFAGEMVRQGGKEVADSAIRAVHCLSPDECLTTAERTGLAKLDAMQAAGRRRAQAVRDAEYEAYLRRLAPHLLPKPRKPVLRRVAAMVLLVLAVALAGLLGGSSRASAAPEPGARWKALAACGRATIGSAEYDRRCRQFSRTERSVVRDYDGEGAGAPREWGQPKEWASEEGE